MIGEAVGIDETTQMLRRCSDIVRKEGIDGGREEERDGEGGRNR
jgi:hypothetical protein